MSEQSAKPKLDLASIAIQIRKIQQSCDKVKEEKEGKK